MNCREGGLSGGGGEASGRTSLKGSGTRTSEPIRSPSGARKGDPEMFERKEKEKRFSATSELVTRSADHETWVLAHL